MDGKTSDDSFRSYKKCFILFLVFYLPFRHEVININLKNKPEWFFEKNPFGLVPVLENSQGQLIYESAITCEYLDEVYPGKKLLPEDPYEKARQKMVFELFSKVCV